MILSNEQTRLTWTDMPIDFHVDDRGQVGVMQSTSRFSPQSQCHVEAVEAVGPLPNAELEHAIQCRIAQMNGGQIHSIAVRVLGYRVLVSGKTHSYYQKQLVLQGVLEAIRGRDELQIELNVEVVGGGP